MITVISSTNRKDNKTQIFAKAITDILKSKTVKEVKYLDLEDLNGDMLHALMYQADQQSPKIAKLQDEYIMYASKIVFVMPEYNGGIPGILKLFIDAISVREYGKTFSGKKVGMIGTASGRAGNLRGIDHLIGICNHVGMIAYPKNLPISSIGSLVDDNGKINKETTEAMTKFVDGFLEF